MIDDRSLERMARAFIEIGPTAPPPRVIDDVLLVIDHTPQERDWLPWRFPSMPLPARFVALVAIGALIVAGAFAIGTIGSTSPPATEPSSAPTGAPTGAAGDRAAAVRVAADFLERLNSGDLDAAAAMVELGAYVDTDVSADTREEVLAALSTACGLGDATLFPTVGNDVRWDGFLIDRPGYDCPLSGMSVHSRIDVVDGMVVYFRHDEYRPQ